MLDAGRAALCTLALCFAGCATVGGSSPPETKFMEVNGTRLAYVDEGRGDPVVLVHGAFSDWRNWDAMRPAITARHRFIALSLRYHYPNAWSDDGSAYSLAQHVQDVAAFIKGLSAGKVHLVANSMGSRIAAYVALEHPDLLRSITLGDPFVIAPTSPEGKAAIGAFMADASRSSAAAKSGDLRQSTIELYNAVLGDPDGFRLSPADVQSRVLDNAPSLGPYWRQPPAKPVTCDQFRALPMPVMVINGERSIPIFQQGSQALRACLPPTARHHVLRGARHNWFAEHPQDGAVAVLEFVALH